MIIERLYEGKEIPEGTSKKRVMQVKLVLLNRFNEKLRTPYIWAAACYVAVVAGERGGRRRVQQRQKLYAMLKKCYDYLGEEMFELPKGWELENLYFGFDAIPKLAQRTGISPSNIILMGALKSGMFERINNETVS